MGCRAIGFAGHGFERSQRLQIAAALVGRGVIGPVLPQGEHGQQVVQPAVLGIAGGGQGRPNGVGSGAEVGQAVSNGNTAPNSTDNLIYSKLTTVVFPALRPTHGQPDIAHRTQKGPGAGRSFSSGFSICWWYQRLALTYLPLGPVAVANNIGTVKETSTALPSCLPGANRGNCRTAASTASS